MGYIVYYYNRQHSPYLLLASSTATVMQNDKLVRPLFKLRRNHLAEVITFHADEKHLLYALSRYYRDQLSEAGKPAAKAALVLDNLLAVRRLQTERELRFLAMKNRHEEEIANLFRFQEQISSASRP